MCPWSEQLSVTNDKTCGPEQIVNSVKLVLALHLFLKTLSPTSDVFRELARPQSLTFTTPALSQKFS